MEVNFAIVIVTVVIMNLVNIVIVIVTVVIMSLVNLVNIVKLMIVRWDCEESSQIWASCSDVKIKPKI